MSDMVKHTSSSSSAISDDLRKEFEQNYRRYLENAYLFNRINEILLDSEITASSVPDQVRAVDSSDESVKMTKKLRQKFLQAINMSSAIGQNSAVVVPDFSQTTSATMSRLSNEEKQFLRTKISIEVDQELDLINQVLNCHFEEKNQNDDIDMVPVKLCMLLDSIDQLENKAKISKADFDVKLQHCLKHSVELMSMLRRMLAEFKLNFYAHKNTVQCEQDLHETELLLAKVELTSDELTAELYSTDKLRALGCVRSHLDEEVARTNEACRRAQMELDAYKALGKEFETIVGKYSSLKKDLEVKKLHLKMLKDDINF